MIRQTAELNEQVILPEGYPFLVHSTAARDWSLWMGETLHVAWNGSVQDPPVPAAETWGSPQYIAYAITHEEFATLKMAALHIRTSGAWQRLAKRIANESIVNLCATTMPRANTGDL